MTETFETAILNEIGHAPKRIIADGKPHRFDIGKHKGRGWYVLHDGKFPTGVFGDWGTGEQHKWHLKNGACNLTAADRILIRERKAKQDAEAAIGYARAAEEALSLWEKAAPANPTHPYLVKKHVQPHGIREGADGDLLVPVFIDGRIASLQMIDNDGAKLFVYGAKTGGGGYLIGDPGDHVVIGEGYATVATLHEMTGLAVAAAFSAGNLMAVARAIRRNYPQAKITIAADDDFKTERNKGFNPGIREAQSAAKAVGAHVAIPLFNRNSGECGTDWNDFAAARGHDVAKATFSAKASEATAKEEGKPRESAQIFDFEVARLAKLRAEDYAQSRTKEAKQLGVRATDLDKFVKAARPQDDKLTSRALKLETPEAWPDFVNGAALLNEFVAQIRKYVVLTEEDADAVALCCLHTFIYEAFHCTPRLAITSPQKRCGKTTLLSIIQGIAARALYAANTSPPAVFRTVESAKPTLIIDEADTFLTGNEELRGVLNSGHTVGGQVIRTVGDDHESRVFSTHSPCVIAMIGELPDTLADRSVSISLKRRLASEPVSRFRLKKATEGFTALARKAVRWSADNTVSIGASDPDLPESLFNRDADNWEPLFTIAEVAGGNWRERAEKADACLDAARLGYGLVNPRLQP
jgi:putative DNA primase/helicase